MHELPVHQVRDSIVQTLSTNNRLILEAPTGSGKSTQVPQYVIDHDILPENKLCVVLQPRRLAARMLAARISYERGQKTGDEVGYHIRFDRIQSSDTKILFLTEGLLLRQLLGGKKHESIGTIIFDEFHERNLYTDCALALARKLQETIRPDLKIIIMSATLQSEAILKWFEGAELIRTSGRTYPVDIHYSAAPKKVAEKPLWEKAAWHAEQYSSQTNEGHILIFMPGAFEIHRTIRALESYSSLKHFDILPLHGELSPADQDRAVNSTNSRKIIVSTNVAETSLTIDNIRVVIDSGLARIARYDSKRGINTILSESISRTSADQRAGRAGRTAEGLCLRIWGEKEHAFRPEQTTPEIHRVDLSPTLLQLYTYGTQNIDELPWFETPNADRIASAHTLLKTLGAIDQEHKPTERGHAMARFPLHPRLSRLLIAANEYNCVESACKVAALTESRDVLLPIKNKAIATAREDALGDPECDLQLRIHALHFALDCKFSRDACEAIGLHAQTARQTILATKQYLQIAKSQGINSETDEIENLGRCLLAAYPEHVGIRNSRGTLHYKMPYGRAGELRRESAARDSDLILALNLEEREQAQGVKVMLSLATPIQQDWLQDDRSDVFSAKEHTYYDAKIRRVVARSETRYLDLVLSSKELTDPPKNQAAALLAEEILSGREELKLWNSAVDEWIARVNFVAKYCPEYEILPIDDEAKRLLIEQVCHGSYSIRDLRNKEVLPVFHKWLSPEERAAVKSLAPAEWTLPNRKRPVKLRYQEDGKVVISAPIQSFYGVPGKTLQIANNVFKLTIELLAPNQRPVQITDDIDGFWDGAFPTIRKELKGRYPKHNWDLPCN